MLPAKLPVGLGKVEKLLVDLFCSDSGSGVEALRSRDFILPEEALGTDLATLLSEIIKSDLASGIDLSQLLAILTEEDTGIGEETLGDRGFILPDEGIGTEALGDRDLVITEDGIGSDLAALLYEIVKSDSGMGWDTIVAFLMATVKFGSDSGIGTDISLPLLVRHIRPMEVGLATERVLNRDFGIEESGIGTDALIDFLVSLLKTESGLGTDFASKGIFAIDSGAGTDVLDIIKAIFESQEQGTGIDISKLAAFFDAIDSGIGTDILKLNTVFIVQDEGAGVDIRELIEAAMHAQEQITSIDLSELGAIYIGMDSGTGTDALKLSTIFKLQEEGIGVDVRELIRAILKAQEQGIGIEFSFMEIKPLGTKVLVVTLYPKYLTTRMRDYRIMGRLRKA